MKIQTIFGFVVACGLAACSPEKPIDPDFRIQRFDRDLYRYLTENLPVDSLQKYQAFLDDYNTKILPDFSDSTLMQIYRDEQRIFSDISGLQTEVPIGMEKLSEHFPDLQRPEIYLHVSGWNQHVVVGENYVSLSADYYLGSDYPLYQPYFYNYQLLLMTPERMAPDLLLGFLTANFPFRGNESVLLDKMLYEGKLRYILSQILPKRKIWEFVGYSQEQYEWCRANQSRIWKSILENQHLFRSDYNITSQYLRESPYTATLPAESPGRVGVWLGFQIIQAYMKRQPKTTWAALINDVDYVRLLKESKYRP